MNKRFLEYFYFLGNILGVSPRANKTPNNAEKLYSRIYIPTISVLLSLEFGRFVYVKVEWYNIQGHFIKLLLETLSKSILTMDILLTIFFMNYKQNRKWRVMNKYLNIVDNKLAKYGGHIDTGILGHAYIDVCFLSVIFLVTNALCIWSFYGHLEISVYINLTKVYYWYMIVLVYLTVTRIRNGLKKLHAFLETIFPPKKEYGTTEVTSVQPFNVFSEFMKCYRIIYDVVHIFNDIFGYHMVFLNLNCILEWLSALNLIISNIKEDSLEVDVIAVTFLHAATILIGNILIILLCSSVTSEGEYFLYVLHQIEDDKNNLKAKSIVIQLVEDMPLHFSAARFFNISKYTILGIIGNCTTYFIVLIQFYQ